MTDIAELTKLINSLEEFIQVPGAHTWLRRAVLELAMTGRLLPNGATSQTAADVLDEIGAAAIDLNALDPFGQEVVAEFPLPDTWSWATFKAVAEVAANLVQPSKYQDEIHVAPNNIEKATGVLLPCRTVREDGVSSANNLFHSGQILYSKIRPELSKAVVVDFGGLCSADMYPINPLIDRHYLHLYLLSPIFLKQVNRHANRLAMPKVNKSDLNSVLVPVPPKDEQRRIGDRVHELFSLIKRYEEAAQQADVARRELSNMAFRRLGLDADMFALEHLHDLVSTVDDVNDLEIAIRELAVRGRLTSRAPEGTPLEALTDDVQAKTIDAPKLVDRRGQDIEEPYELPAGWSWVILGSLLSDIQAGWSPAAQPQPKQGDGWGVLKVSACSWGQFRPEENKALLVGQEPRPELEVKTGDLLISRANTAELVARSVVVETTPPHLMLSDKTLRLTSVRECNPRYLNLANLARSAREHYEREASGTSSSMLNVSQKVIRLTPIPLPPRAEQDRIVAAVDRLMDPVRQLRTAVLAGQQ